jgi:small subunit ribosomal protein S21
MLIVKVNQNTNIEKALKLFKSKVIKTKLMSELRNRKQFTKKSVTRRTEINKAKYVQQIKSKED